MLILSGKVYAVLGSSQCPIQIMYLKSQKKSSISIMRLEFPSSQWTLLLNSHCYGRVLMSSHGFLDSAYAVLLGRFQSMIEEARKTQHDGLPYRTSDGDPRRWWIFE